jgi:hypothetical protein
MIEDQPAKALPDWRDSAAELRLPAPHQPFPSELLPDFAGRGAERSPH